MYDPGRSVLAEIRDPARLSLKWPTDSREGSCCATRRSTVTGTSAANSPVRHPSAQPTATSRLSRGGLPQPRPRGERPARTSSARSSIDGRLPQRDSAESYEKPAHAGVRQHHRVARRYGKRALSSPLPATRLSDGTIRFIALLAILCHPEPPPLICIEEPEIAMHPDSLRPGHRRLLMRKASQRTQLIVTTHSP